MELDVFFFRLFLALILGAGIGLERQIKQRSAGLVTNSLVSLGAAIYILTSISVKQSDDDVLRVIGQIVTGIGFLGAGVIMRDGFTVHGLNTAATLWCSAAVGSLAAFGLWIQGIVAAATIVSVHLFFKPLVDYINQLPYNQKISVKNIGYKISVLTNQKNETTVRTICTDYLAKYEGLQLRQVKSIYEDDSEKVEILLEVLSYEPKDGLIQKFAKELTDIDVVFEVHIVPLKEAVVR